MAEISVIMLTYNRKNFVGRAIDSIINQTFKDFEFVIVNNGSDDGTDELLKKYELIDSRIKIITKDKGNIGSGRNAGFYYSTSPYIMYIDDDDYAEPDMLAFLYHLIRKYEADISLCGSFVESNGKRTKNKVFDEVLVMNAEKAVIELLNREKYNIAMPTKLLKRHLLEEIKFLENGKYDDISVGYRFFAISNRIVGHGLPKYTFYRHESNNSDFTTNDLLITPKQLNEYFDAFRDRTVYISEQLPSLKDFVFYSELSFMISMCNKIISNNLSDCTQQLEHVKETLRKHYTFFYNCEYIKDFEKNWMEKYIQSLKEVVHD